VDHITASAIQNHRFEKLRMSIISKTVLYQSKSLPRIASEPRLRGPS